MNTCDVLLVSMPFYSLEFPSIALGTLKAVLDRAGIASECRSYHFAFMEHLLESQDGAAPTLQEYQRVLDQCHSGLGDWVFCVPAFRDGGTAVDERFAAYLRSRKVSEADIALAQRLRPFAPSFLEKCLQDVLTSAPRMVGFTTMFSQNIASLALAKMIKQSNPAIQIVFGGANCDGPMGEALHRAFPCIDVVVRGEGERLLPEIARDVIAGRPVRPLDGLCIRRDAEIIVGGKAEPVGMDEVPMPNYDEHFERLAAAPFADDLRTLILFETSRGCWWGEKAHCTFCGLNGSTMKYRSKSPERMFEEVTTLSRRYQKLGFWAVDNIIDMDYFHSVLPKFRDAGYDIRMFFETKANLKRHQVRLLRDSGIIFFQPGIESLSTPILKLMRKGVTALQNIRLLKWVREFGLQISYHVLGGFPNEPPEEYDRMAAVMPSLSHLPPPDHLNRLHIDRFSPLHMTPRELGLEIEAPLGQYTILYPVDTATASEIAYYFSPRYLDGRDPETYFGKCREAIATWNQNYRPAPTLHYRRGPGFVVIDDERGPAGTLNRYTLTDWQAEAFMACEAGAMPEAVLKACHAAGETAVSSGEVTEFLGELLEARLAYEEDGRYLSLPVADNPDGLDRSREATPEEAAPRDPQLVSIGLAPRLG
jgi:ribosomal peptide maturation radical SAM protein 1